MPISRLNLSARRRPCGGAACVWLRGACGCQDEIVEELSYRARFGSCAASPWCPHGGSVNGSGLRDACRDVTLAPPAPIVPWPGGTGLRCTQNSVGADARARCWAACPLPTAASGPRSASEDRRSRCPARDPAVVLLLLLLLLLLLRPAPGACWGALQLRRRPAAGTVAAAHQ